MLVCKHLFEPDTQVALCMRSTINKKTTANFERHECLPKRLSMDPTRVELEITPPRRGIVTVLIRAVKPEKNERFFHHVLRLEMDAQFGILVRDRVGCVGREIGVGRSGEDDCRLRRLSDRIISAWTRDT